MKYANRIDDKGVVVYLKDIFKYTDVNIIQDYITKIDFEKQELISEKITMPTIILLWESAVNHNFME